MTGEEHQDDFSPYQEESEIVQGNGPREPEQEYSSPDQGKSLDAALLGIFGEGSRMRPGFANAWVSLKQMDMDSRLMRYHVSTSRIDICSSRGGAEILYRITPREYTLPDEGLKLLHNAKREFVGNVKMGYGTSSQLKSQLRGEASDTLRALAKSSGISPGQLESIGGIEFLTDALLRHTVGLGILEYLLDDPAVQDIYIDAPADQNPVHMVLGDMGNEINGKCVSNIILSQREVESLVSKFRFVSGRPFSESMPVLETDLHDYDTRVTVVGKPLSPGGIGIALRRHSTDPWTLPRLISKGSIDPLGAGLLSFLIDGRSTILVAGSRGAGKSSLLGALMLEFPVSQRILTIEDTLELPGAKMQELGYKVQSLFVKSALGGTGDRTADDALRVSLRLGESAIVLGEVRGREAKTLYEAMRSGSAGSAVLGTIHGNSPRSVFERIVYDLDIHPEAFSATDIVVVCGLVRPGGRQRQVRRVVSISELVKEGDQGEFRELMYYDDENDSLIEADGLYDSERINDIAEQWGIDYDQAIENIRARAVIRRSMVDASVHDPDMLSAPFVVQANAQYWNLVDRLGSGKSGELASQWVNWFRRGQGHD